MSSVRLAWNASAGATFYDVYRDGVRLTPAGGIVATTYTDTAVSPGSTYSYDVDAGNAAGTSAASAAVRASIPVAGRIPLSPLGGLNLFAFVHPGGSVSAVNATAASLAGVGPAIDGISWTFSWADIQPTIGGPIDPNGLIEAALAATAAQGRRAFLRVIGGKYSAGRGGPEVTITYTDAAGVTATVSVPILWSATYVSNFTAFIRAFGARYGADPRFELIQMAGCGIIGEMQIPDSPVWTSTAAPPNGCGSDTYTATKLVGAWEMVIDAYHAAFPSKFAGLGQGGGGPISNATTVIAPVRTYTQRYWPQVSLQQEDLGHESLAQDQAMAALAASTNVGWQTWLAMLTSGGATTPGMRSPASTLDAAIASHGRYVETYLTDCRNPSLYPTFAHYAALNPG
jgi:hypothetical protein